MTNQLHLLAVLSLAVSAASLTVARSTFFEPLRAAAMERVPILGKLLRCPYCLSHWFGFAGVLSTGLTLVDGALVNLVLATFAVIGLASIVSGAIFTLMLHQEHDIERLQGLNDKLRQTLRELA